MNIAKVTYEDKEAIQNDETIAEKNKVTANNMNQIKKAINDNADFLTEVKNTVDELNGEYFTTTTNNEEGKIALKNYIEQIGGTCDF